MILSISDGMGSGLAAYKESEAVIDLLEQFLGSGFDKETAIRDPQFDAFADRRAEFGDGGSVHGRSLHRRM